MRYAAHKHLDEEAADSATVEVIDAVIEATFPKNDDQSKKRESAGVMTMKDGHLVARNKVEVSDIHAAILEQRKAEEVMRRGEEKDEDEDTLSISSDGEGVEKEAWELEDEHQDQDRDLDQAPDWRGGIEAFYTERAPAMLATLDEAI